jgi:membrane protease subunit (stomatin/prohibitin family)
VLLWLLVMRRRAASNLPLAFASSKDAEVGAAAAAGGKSEGHLGSLSGTSPNDSSTAATRWDTQQQQQQQQQQHAAAAAARRRRFICSASDAYLLAPA